MNKSEVLEKENDEGNYEYKWKLVNLTETRFNHLVTQMSFRLSEGIF
jgi:GTPase